MDYVLAIDLGTSSLRLRGFDLKGDALGQLVQMPHRLRTDATGMAEFSPQALWRGLAAGLDQALAGGGTPQAIGMSCFWHGLMACTADGTPLSPVWAWADSRCVGDAQQLRQRHEEAEWHQRSGCMLRASFWPAKLAWIRRAQPALWSATERWCGPAEWLMWRLTGQWHSAHGMATATGLYDPTARDWSDELLARCGIARHQLPVVDDGALALAPRWRRRWPALTNTALHPAIGDGAAANLGAGATIPGTAAITVGTTAAIRVVRRGRRAIAPFGLFCYRIDRDRHLVGGAVSNAGSLRAWCVEHLRLPDDDGLERLLAARSGPDPRLVVIPRWHAERAPDWRDDLSGAIVGLGQDATASDVFLAVTAAGYLRLAAILDCLPGPQPRLIVGGGIQRSAGSLRRLADCLGAPLHPASEAETSLRGAAVLVLERLGHRLRHPTGRAVRPDPTLAAAWAGQRRRQQQLDRLLDHPDGSRMHL